jgi:hypothetical protein
MAPPYRYQHRKETVMRTRLLAAGLATTAAIAVTIAIPAAANAQPSYASWQCANGVAELIGGVYVVTGLQCVNYGGGGTFGTIAIPAETYNCSSITDLPDGLAIVGTGCTFDYTTS